DEAQVPVALARALQAPDEHAEAGAVEVLDLRRIDDDLRLALVQQVDDLLLEARRGVDVHLAGQSDNRDTFFRRPGFDFQIHPDGLLSTPPGTLPRPRSRPGRPQSGRQIGLRPASCGARRSTS